MEQSSIVQAQSNLPHVQAALAEIVKLYDTDLERNTSTNFLLIGDIGSGKSSALSTARMPALVHSFDPGGTSTKELRPLIRSKNNPKGPVIVDTRFEMENAFAPFAWKMWEYEMNKLIQSGIFAHIGTYMLDSMTKWSSACLFQVLKEKNLLTTRQATRAVYRMVLDTMVNEMVRLMALPCDVVVTGHIDYSSDETTGQNFAHPMVIGQSRVQIPIVFHEVYFMIVQQISGGGNKHMFLTQHEGIYKAANRLGLEKYVEPNIKELLKGAGKPFEDKPNI